ncbi:MAG: hypothetical protein JWO94_83 [Verrucomicrobiaceae bacterium]|nr:hypothetical protein [Verrucomicrobiaceae bacterium]
MLRDRNTYWLEAADHGLGDLAPAIFRRVFRQTFEMPGFAVVTFPTISSKELREAMVRIKAGLSVCLEKQWGEHLEYLSLGRFDQQTTTKLHLDGAPERSILMLGYEPTEVASDILIADYAACAHAMGLSPAEYLTQHNPMLTATARMLDPFLTSISEWSEDRSRMIIINNSSASTGHPRPLAGVLHGARILKPDATKVRIINSILLGVSARAETGCSKSVMEFLATDAVSGPIVVS